MHFHLHFVQPLAVVVVVVPEGVVVVVLVVVVVGSGLQGASTCWHVSVGAVSGSEQSQDGQNRNRVSQLIPSDVPQRHVPPHPGPFVVVVGV
jgi:hypothetical protein